MSCRSLLATALLLVITGCAHAKTGGAVTAVAGGLVIGATTTTMVKEDTGTDNGCADTCQRNGIIAISIGTGLLVAGGAILVAAILEDQQAPRDSPGESEPETVQPPSGAPLF